MLNAWQSASVGVMVVGAAVGFLIVVSMSVAALIKDHPACGTGGAGGEGGGEAKPSGDAPVGRADLEAARALARRLKQREQNKAADRDRVHGPGWVNGKSRLDLVG